MIGEHNPVVVALDLPTAESALRMARQVASEVGALKIGLGLLMGPGPATIAAVGSLDLPVLADAKLHDIPNTVRHASEQLGRMGARWITVHAAGGRAMCEAAVEGLASGADGAPAGVIAVTVLTSLGESELAAIGVPSGAGKQTARLTRLAAAAGCEGAVCSTRQLGVVRQVEPDLVRFVPGIRRVGEDKGDQVETATPGEAIAKGADFIVVGRPIIGADDPVAAAQQIARAAGQADDM